MKLNILAHSLRVIFTGGMTVGMGLMVNTAHADDKVERVEVTGSSIKGIAAQSASPITIVKVEQLAAAGVTTAEEALGRISANQSQFGVSNNIGNSKTSGPTADLRALGANKTLVLLNGRRVAPSPFDGSVTDLSIIPLAALDRIEILRDGASAIYGTDAIGGVINFITKRSVNGLTATIEGNTPTHHGGGQEGRVNLTGGFGDLDKDGYNLFGVVDYHSQQALLASDRSFSSQGYNRPDLGLSPNGLSSNSPQANFATPDLSLAGNPYAHVCDAPNEFVSGSKCRYNSQSQIGITPQYYQFGFLTKGTFKIDDNNKLGFEYLHSESDIKTLTAATTLSGVSNAQLGSGVLFTIPDTSKYYPGSGITPASPNATGGDLLVNSRTTLLGPRINDTLSKQDRFVLSADGNLWNWDYKTGVSFTKSTAVDRLIAGYVNDTLVNQALLNGTYNPFGAPTAADAGVLATLPITGPYEQAETKATSVDFTISRPIFTLPAGDVGFALGTSYRHETANYDVDYDVAKVVSSVGLTDAKSAAGRRDVAAVFSELQVPILKTLEAQFAVRYDHYSDAGGTTNPKVAFRWQPLDEVMFRGSFSTGFRAPSLYELNNPNAKQLGSSFNDPILCPGGNVAPGGVDSRDCGQQFGLYTGGNRNLKPETSKSYTTGIVLQPVKDVTMSVDYYNITMKHTIGTIAESDIFDKPTEYANLYVRNPDGSISYVIAPTENLGGIKTSGIDTDFNWRIPTADWGTFNLGLSGTYTNTYKYQNTEGGDWLQNAGVFSGVGPVFRWIHTASVSWKYKDWSTLVDQQYKSGYHDDNSAINIDGYPERGVASYSVFDLSETYSGFKGLSLTAGVKNIFNRNPPASNTENNFQGGYDSRYYSPLGRVLFLRATYKFL